MRDRVGMVDLSAFAIFDITGPGRARPPPGDGRRPDGRAGRPGRLHAAAQRGRRDQVADLTIMRLGDDRFRVVTGGAHGHGRQEMVPRPPAADGSAQLYDATSAWCTVGVWGPRARDVVAVGRPRTTSRTRASRSGRPRTIELGGDPRPRLADLVRRRARLGAVRPDGAGPPAVGHALGGGPAARHRRRRASASTATTGRLEKGYRAHGAELELEFDLVEAGMLRPKVKDADFIGRDGVPRAAVAAGRRDAVHADGRRQRRRRAASSATCSAASRS